MSSPSEAPYQLSRTRRSCDAASACSREPNCVKKPSTEPAWRAVCRAIAWMTASRFFDRCARQPDDFPGLVSKRFDMQIVPANSGRIFERHFRPLGLATCKHLAFRSDNGGTAIEGQNFRIRTAKNLFNRPAQHWIADRRVTKISVLRIHGHLRTAQGGFISREACPQ